MTQAPARPQRRRAAWRPALDDPGDVSPEWDRAVDAFLRDGRARNCSTATIQNYRAYLLGPRAVQFVADHRVRSVADVTPEKIRSFQAELLDAGLSPGTAATFHRVVRNFLGFCRREGWGVPPEALETAPPRQPILEPGTFTEDEESRILAAARHDRDRFLIEFMLRTGLRLSEVANVTLDDIVDGPDGAYLRVRHGKGAKDRVVPLDTGHDRFSRRLRSYVRHVRPAQARDGHLFLSLRSDPRTGDHAPLDREAIKSLCQRLSVDTGIHVHPHKFRHTFATRALRAGVDSLVLQRALGHSALAMVNRYVHYQKSDLLEAWRRRSD